MVRAPSQLGRALERAELARVSEPEPEPELGPEQRPVSARRRPEPVRVSAPVQGSAQLE